VLIAHHLVLSGYGTWLSNDPRGSGSDETRKNELRGRAFEEVARERGHTVWSCAVLRNHAHLCVRVHRDDAITMRDAFATASRDAVLALGRCDPDHPVWSSRPYKVFLDTPEAVVAEINYIWRNPEKEGLPTQHWDFVQPYNGWPFHKRR
jgi:hypothetical protein